MPTTIYAPGKREICNTGGIGFRHFLVGEMRSIALFKTLAVQIPWAAQFTITGGNREDVIEEAEIIIIWACVKTFTGPRDPNHPRTIVSDSSMATDPSALSVTQKNVRR